MKTPRGFDNWQTLGEALSSVLEKALIAFENANKDNEKPGEALPEFKAPADD